MAKITKEKTPETRRRFAPDAVGTYTATAETTLLPFLLETITDRKRTAIKELLKHSQIKVGDVVTTKFDYPLQPGDIIHVNYTRSWPTFYNRRVKLVYEDDDIVVINKGYGLLSMGTDRIKDGTAYSIVREWVKTEDPRNKLFIVHRLDQNTSGLMMFAKSEEAKERMQHNWNNMVLNRKYLAVVEGDVADESGEVRSYLAENSRFEVYSTDDPEKGKLAVTRYKVLARNGDYTLLEVELDTGRKNQIRVHMHDLGHPIAGDRKYGGHTSPIHRLALHAQTLRFVHPTTRKQMNFTTPVPQAFEKMMGAGRGKVKPEAK